MIGALPKEAVREFLPEGSIRERQNHDNFMQYAKQRELLANIDKKLDYHNLQEERHPEINDLRAAMKQRSNTRLSPNRSPDAALSSNLRFVSSAMDANAQQQTIAASRNSAQASLPNIKVKVSIETDQPAATKFPSAYRVSPIGTLMGSGKPPLLNGQKMNERQISIDYTNLNSIQRERLGAMDSRTH